MSSSYRSWQGLNNRLPTTNDQLQVRVDPLQGDLDEEIDMLHSKVRNLRGVAEAIETESKYQNELLNQLESAVMKAQAGLKNTMKRLNRSIIQNGSNHLLHVILFALLCFFLVYLWSKLFR
ncbi:hypothetical protein KP509_15G008500 [Ceratopteris richardii]|uniref:t-SNARE coiled-coil homology domain-containing protein n=1 Tax=Ceratopteris richardii TaxID=49495 RepID=A0A8T2T4I4_CERRI|nr:hypothetical protein KP509_15G008500 [Ceratopteris richardii]KAH7404051.1 hypothetical protein KP509_15G008500 [Ceratopteris richardii]